MKGEIKIGLLSVHSGNYYAEEDRVLETQLDKIKKLEAELHITLLDGPLVADMREAMLQKERYQTEHIDFLLILNAGFSMGEILRIFSNWNTPVGIWAIPETVKNGDIRLHSMVSMNLYLSIIKKTWKNKVYTKWFYGDADSLWFRERFTDTVKALKAYKALSGGRVGLIGAAAPGFDNLIVSESAYKEKTGVEIQTFDTAEIKRIADRLPDREVAAEVESIRGSARECLVGEEDLKQGARVYLALKNLAVLNKLDAMAVSCWPDIQDLFHIVPCVPFTLLGNTLDIPVACEGDAGAAVTMLAMKEISGRNPVIMDVTAVDTQKDAILLWHCGIGTKALEPEFNKIRITLHPMMNRKSAAERRIGLSYDYYFKNTTVTVSRITGNADGFLAFQAAVIGDEGGYDGTRGYIGGFNHRGKAYHVPDIMASLLDGGIEHHLVLTEGCHEQAVFEVCELLRMKNIRLKCYQGPNEEEEE